METLAKSSAAGERAIVETDEGSLETGADGLEGLMDAFLHPRATASLPSEPTKSRRATKRRKGKALSTARERKECLPPPPLHTTLPPQCGKCGFAASSRQYLEQHMGQFGCRKAGTMTAVSYAKSVAVRLIKSANYVVTDSTKVRVHSELGVRAHASSYRTLSGWQSRS